MSLYHYCCSHSLEGIQRDGLVLPNQHPFIKADLVWLTDLPTPDRARLGLTSNYIRCDRTEWRITVGPDGAVWWPRWAREHGMPRHLRDDLEAFGWPAHWYVAETPCSVLAVERTAGVAA